MELVSKSHRRLYWVFGHGHSRIWTYSYTHIPWYCALGPRLARYERNIPQFLIKSCQDLDCMICKDFSDLYTGHLG